MTDTTGGVDELATALRDDPGGATVLALWRAVYGLEHWWLLPTGDPADPRPMVGVVDDRTFLLAFTSEDQVRAFATRAADGQPRDTATAAMSITPEDMTGLAPALLRQGVAGIVFDQGVHGFVAPAAALDSMWERFGRPPTTPPDDDAPAPGTGTGARP